MRRFRPLRFRLQEGVQRPGHKHAAKASAGKKRSENTDVEKKTFLIASNELDLLLN